MTERMTGMSPPVYLGMPLDPPDPVPGCPICARAARARSLAQSKGWLSAMTDANVRIRRHPHEGARPAS